VRRTCGSTFKIRTTAKKDLGKGGLYGGLKVSQKKSKAEFDKRNFHPGGPKKDKSCRGGKGLREEKNARPVGNLEEEH